MYFRRVLVAIQLQEYRSEKTLERMYALLPPVCKCLRNGVVDTVYAKSLVPGDVVHLSVGDRVPADVRLVRVNELAVDESSFTGETEPKYKSTELRPEAAAKARLEVNDMNNVGFQVESIVMYLLVFWTKFCFHQGY